MINDINFNYYIIFFFISLIYSYLLVRISKNIFSGKLLDNDFLKPQAFHSKPTARIGGVLIISLFIFFIFFFYKSIFFFLDYLIFSITLFSLGFLDDLKIKITPNKRLLGMIFILIILIEIFSIEINRSGLSFLNLWLENKIFQNSFVLLCFLFIINGSNMIDGFNGQLGIHFLIITIIYFIINLTNNNYSFSYFLLGQLVIIFLFLIFNFPNAKIFLGDSGSYLLGVFISINTIKTYELNTFINPFFFSSILFYIFFEVYFSFLRKSFKKNSPTQPDNFHLHMLLYKVIKMKTKYKNINYLVAIIINIFYIFLILPLYFFKENPLFCRYYFFILLTVYLCSYYKLYYKANSNENI